MKLKLNTYIKSNFRIHKCFEQLGCVTIESIPGNTFTG